MGLRILSADYHYGKIFTNGHNLFCFFTGGWKMKPVSGGEWESAYNEDSPAVRHLYARDGDTFTEYEGAQS